MKVEEEEEEEEEEVIVLVVEKVGGGCCEGVNPAVSCHPGKKKYLEDAG